MLDATRSRIQTVYAFPRAGVYAPRRILYDAVDCVARQPVRSFINLHPKMRTSGVIDHPKSVRGSDPQSPADIGSKRSTPFPVPAYMRPAVSSMMQLIASLASPSEVL